ncbi:MAG: carboxypeptidase regulatory-like domain-containing protein [Terriglobia bacterium]
MRKLCVYALFAIVAVAVFASVRSFGQVTGTGTIEGIVVDQTGAVVVGAQVTITEVDTGSFQGQNSNKEGRFTFASVKPGGYDVSVTMKGFRKMVLSGQELPVGGQLNLNLSLEVGAANQTVEVTSTPGADLQTLSSTMSSSVGGNSLIELPSIDRDAASILYSVPMSAPKFNGAEGNVTSGQIAGATSDQNMYYLDGGNNSSGLEGDNAYINGGHGVVPMPMESIQEFTINTNNMTADFSASSGGEVIVSTKRGTNQWHGSGYDFYQDGALNSNDWYNNFQGIPKSLVHQNRFGGALGGPLTPHIAGGKTYFYVNYEGYRYPRSSPTEEGVPSAMMRNGVLQFADGSGNLIQYDLKTSTQCGATGGLACDPRGIGLNPVVSQIWSKYVPLPNDFHTGDLTNGNYYGFIGNLSYPQSDDFMVGRIDHDFGSKWRAFASYRWFNDSNANASQVDYGGVLPGDTVGHPASASSTAVKPRYFVIGVTGNLAPSVTNEFHFSYTRNYWHWNRAGAVPYISGTPDGLEFGEQNATSATLFAPINMDTQDARERLWGEHNNDFRDTVSWIKGTHYLQFGGDLMHQWWHFDRYDDVTGGLIGPFVAQMASVDGNPAMTSDFQPVPCAASTSANCLPGGYLTEWNSLYANTLGTIGQSATVISRSGVNLTPNPVGAPASSYAIVPTYSLYFSDAWRIKPSLTLTYGMNYGVQMPPYEIHGQQDIMVDGQNNPISVESVLANKLTAANAGGIFIQPFGYTPIRGVSLNGQNKYPYTPFYGGLSPRVGLAYSPSADGGVMGKLFGHKSTVIRGGYSRFYDRSLGINLVSDPVLGDGFIQPISCIGPTMSGGCTGAAGTTPATSFRIGVDGNAAPAPGIAPSLASPVMPGLNGVPSIPLGSTMDTNFRPGSSDEIDFSIQRQLPGNMIVEVGYTGRWAKHIYAGVDTNDVPWMMKLNGQTLAGAWDNVYHQVTSNQTVTAQPWFETALGGPKSAYCSGFSSCTAAAASNLGSYIGIDDLTDTWAGLDGAGAFSFGSNTIPFMNQDTATYNSTSIGFANYQALVVSVTKHTAHGLTFNGNVTYGHDLGEFSLNQEYTEANPEDPWNPRVDYGPNPWDRKLVINYLGTYELPFGKGRRWSSNNWAVSRLIGGWSAAPIFTWASGLPIESYSGSCEEWGNGYVPWCAGAVPTGNVLAAGNSPHPQVFGDTSTGVATNGNPANGGIGMNMFKDPNGVFSEFRPDLVGLDGRSYDYGPVRGQKRWNLDFGLTKDTRITERVGIQIYGQAFNLFNHMQWGDPGLDLLNPAGFGVISGEYGSIGNGYRRIIQLGARVSF